MKRIDYKLGLLALLEVLLKLGLFPEELMVSNTKVIYTLGLRGCISIKLNGSTQYSFYNRIMSLRDKPSLYIKTKEIVNANGGGGIVIRDDYTKVSNLNQTFTKEFISLIRDNKRINIKNNPIKNAALYVSDENIRAYNKLRIKILNKLSKKTVTTGDANTFKLQLAQFLDKNGLLLM